MAHQLAGPLKASLLGCRHRSAHSLEPRMLGEEPGEPSRTAVCE